MTSDPMVLAQPIHISLIVAVAKNGVIGHKGGLPWRLSSDLKIFRRLTMGKPMIMGRRTFQSLGKPLDGRDNIVVTRDRSFASPGIDVVPDLASALAVARVKAVQRNVNEIMVIGGADIYRQVLPDATRLYWTEVDAEPEGDTVMAPFDRTVWHEVAREPISRGPKDDYDAQLITFERC
jgi:dihydrofolate reductase